MSLMFVGAIIALIVVVTALGGSQTARKWAIGMYCLLAVLLLTISYLYFTKWKWGSLAKRDSTGSTFREAEH